MDLELSGKVVLITGGTDGLGRALARQLILEGAHPVVCGRDPKRVTETAEELGGQGLALVADVTSESDARRLVESAIGTFGRLDGLVNNAGRSAAGPIASSNDDEWREDYELKVIAALRLCRLALPELEKTGGSIINVLAIKGRAPELNLTPTAASRAAGLALTKSLAAEAGPRGVRANAILIGLIESGQWRRRAESMGVSVEEFFGLVLSHQNVPLGRFGRASEFADLASYLLSARSSYVTGTAINLDGGASPVA